MRDRGTLLLLFGALAGVGLAVFEIAGQARAIPTDAIAVVGGVPITAAEFARALDAVRADRRGGELSQAERAAVLSRLVEEELLLQRAFALDLPRRDRRLRGEIVSTLVADVVDGAEQHEPTEDELRRFFEDNAQRFRSEPAARMEQIFFSVPPGADATGVESRARAVASRIARGESFESLQALGDAPPVPLRSGLSSRSSLTEALGPTVARAALELPVGTTGELVRSGTGYHLIRVLERADVEPPDFSSIEDSVRAEYQRRAGENRLRTALLDLRGDADIRLRGP